MLRDLLLLTQSNFSYWHHPSVSSPLMYPLFPGLGFLGSFFPVVYPQNFEHGPTIFFVTTDPFNLNFIQLITLTILDERCELPCDALPAIHFCLSLSLSHGSGYSPYELFSITLVFVAPL